MDAKAIRRGGSEASATTIELPPGNPEHPGLDVLAALFIAADGLIILDRRLRCVLANPAACRLLGYALDELRGRGFLTCLAPDQPHVRDALAAVQPGRWETVLRRPDGSELDILCVATRLDCPGRELMVVSLQDDSERRRQGREAAALAQAAASAAGDSIDATVQALAESALRGTRALGTTVQLDDEDHVAAWIGASGMPDGYADSIRALHRAGSPSASSEPVVAGGRILVDPDARQRLESDPKLAGLPEIVESMPWQGAVIAPLIYQGRSVGALTASYRKSEFPSEGEIAFLATLADQAAVVAMNARLMTAVREKAVLEERQRLSRELHDSVSQALYGIALGARTARDLAEDEPSRIVQPIDYVLQLAEAGMAEMRALIFELRPESLETEGLVAALGRQVEAIRARHGIAVQTTTCEEPDAPLEIKQALYRIAQEALQNTVKHARAGRVEVCLEAKDGEMLLTIQDDGTGFDPGGTFAGHLGLRSMHERALGVGGSLEIASTPGHGTRIRVRVPADHRSAPTEAAEAPAHAPVEPGLPAHGQEELSIPPDQKVNRRGRGKASTTTARLPAAGQEDLFPDVLPALLRASQDGVVILDSDRRYVYANPAACAMLGQPLETLLGRDLLTCPGLDQPHVRDGLAAAAAGKISRWESVLRRPDESELDILGIATRLDGLSRELIGVGLRDDSERRLQAREAAALAQAAATALTGSIDDTVQALAESALRGTRALGATVVLDDEDDIAVWIGVVGMPDGYADSLRDAVRAGWRADHYETLVTAQRMLVDRDARRRVESNPKYARLAELARSTPWQAAVHAPLIYRGAAVGTLNAIYRQDELPSEGEMRFLATLADQAAVVAMNARLMTAARDKVALEERQRLSRELHDSVSQALYGIALGARTARDLAEQDPARVVQAIDYVLQLAETSMAEMRALIFELRPEALESEGLVGALEKQVEAVRARHGIGDWTTTCEEPDASFEIKQALYRIAQEAIQNAVKHARAGRVEVRLEARCGEVLLAIQDDGAGFDPGGTFPGHLGLRSMQERARGIGGSLEVASAPGQGTRILVRVPLPPEATSDVDLGRA